MKEIWKYITDDKIYEVSNLGKTKKNGLIIKQFRNTKGYAEIKVHNKNQLVHRLVAIAFIPNPYNKPQVNHKDGNKLNNNINNLEWCTAKENNEHAIKNNLRRSANGVIPRAIKQYDKEKRLIKEWKNIFEILNNNNEYKAYNIYRSCNKKSSSYGFYWEYA